MTDLRRLTTFLSELPVWLWLLVLVLLPNLLLIATSLQPSQSLGLSFDLTLANYERALGSWGFIKLLGRTLWTAALATTVAALIAYPAACYAARVLAKGRFFALILIIVPLWISLLMRIFAWRMILGEKGILNSTLLSMGLIDKPISALLYSTFSVFLTFVYLCVPFIFIAVYAAIERIPHSLIEASYDCGASRARVFRTVIWPLSRPGTAIGLALAFLMAVGDYITPSMVGGMNGTMLGVVVASQFGIAGDWPYGATLATILLVCVAALLGLMFRLFRVPGILTGESAGGPTATAVSPRKASRLRSGLGFAAFCLPYVFLYLPLVVIGLFAFNDSALQAFPLTGFTFKWFGAIMQDAGLLAALKRSLMVGTLVVAISVLAGTGFALAFAYGRLNRMRWVEQLVALPVAVPGIVLAITLVLVFQLLGLPVGIPRVVLGHASFVMPVVMLTVINRLRRLDPALVEASLDLGASRARTFVSVLLPLIGGALLGGALLGFTLSFDEVVVTQFLTGPEPTLPVWVWNQMRFGFTPSVNAIFVCIGAVSVGLIVLARRLIMEGKGA